MPSPGSLDFVREVFISAPPAVVWHAITDPAMVRIYHLAPLLVLEPRPGGELAHGNGKEILISGTVVDVVENTRLSHTFRFGLPRHPGTEGDVDTLVTYELRPMEEGTLLVLTHGGFTEETQTRVNISGGWPFILQGLKDAAEAWQESQGK